jgi:PTH1 family peptidyl-tRNA hydrolase
MKIIAGLGNPGRRYAGTPHNLGFQVVDLLAERWGLKLQLKSGEQAEVADGRIADAAVRLVKPLTFMNLSGRCIRAVTRQLEWEAEDLLIVTDDVNLQIGRVRFRPGGGHGGHNGLRSIVEQLGHDRFGRLRIGIRPGWEIDDLTEYVLRPPPPVEREQLAEMAQVAADAAEVWIREGYPPVAEKYNGLVRFQDQQEEEI